MKASKLIRKLAKNAGIYLSPYNHATIETIDLKKGRCPFCKKLISPLFRFNGKGKGKKCEHLANISMIFTKGKPIKTTFEFWQVSA